MPHICDSFKIEEGSLNAPGRPDGRVGFEAGLRTVHQMFKMHFAAKIGRPEVSVTDVKGSISSAVDAGCPVAFNNFLPRGCVLRNTTYAIALAIFVGQDTKTCLNSARTNGKLSNMQHYLNMCVWGLLFSLLILCIYAATMSTLQEESFELCCSEQSWIIKIGVFTITFYHVVPMSLYVCFEMLKLILGYQVNSDKQMEDPESGDFAVARTADLIEEMGQINFIFSDKTGTLTKNEMLFARACISGQDVGDFRMKEGCAEPEGVAKCRDGINDDLTSKEAFWKEVAWFFTCLSTCHSVQVAKQKEEEPSTPGSPEMGTKGSTAPPRYLGMSPDEVALVEVSRQVGIVLQDRTHLRGKSSSSNTASELTLQLPGGETKCFSVMYELEFNSDRKRMSVVTRVGSEIYIITKGADSVMEDLLTEPFNEAYKGHIKEYSQLGLRTLVIAFKKVERQAFRKWEKEYKEVANLTDATQARRVQEVQAQLEVNLKMAGVTAVEDCLQDGVPEAIATIKEAGIRLWVLTGDKTETAVDIARSCHLFTDTTTLAYATEATSEEMALQKLQDAKVMLHGMDNGGLVLDGKTIQYCLLSDDCKQLIFDLGIASRSCVCCRLTPLQKRNLIDVVRHKDPATITLAIGDGANDVPMISGAHLGIGVRGKEGAQAVQVSDVAISQFRFLVPLLLCHGRRAYRRVAIYLCYYLYKNVALLMGDVVWMHMDSFRGRIAFPEYLSINYNVFFTSWHILFVLGWDSDVPDAVANANPSLYLVGPARKLFNKTIFTGWIVCGVYHGCAAWIIASAWIIDGAEYHKKIPGQFWEGSLTAFTIIIFVVMLKLLLSSQSPFSLKFSILPTLGAILCYIVILGCISYVPPGPSLQPSLKGIPAVLVKNTNALLAMVTAPLAIISVDFVGMLLVNKLAPSPLDVVKAQIKRNAESSA